MKNHKKALFNILGPYAKVASLSALQKRSGVNYLVPLYHAVNDVVPDHLRFLYPLRNIETFREDLDTLLKYYRPVDLFELISFIREDRTTRPVVHLTFDDGLKDFYHIAAPVLVEKGIPATVFLSTSFIDNHQMMHRHLASLLISFLHNQTAGADAWKLFHQWKEGTGFKQNYYRDMLLSLVWTQKHHLEQLASMLALDINNYLQNEKPYLTSEQIKELIQQGFTVGSHSNSHPEFTAISQDMMLQQVTDSFEILSNQFRVSYRAFSFPFTDAGTRLSFFTRMSESVKPDITFGCAGIKKDVVKNHIQRFPVEEHSGTLKSSLKKELMYYRLLQLAGRNLIRH